MNPATRDCGVVIIALVGGTALEACLRRLEPWENRCLVMLGAQMGDSQSWQSRFPRVRFLEGSGATVPERRLRGLRESPGEVVALLEDTSLPEPGWLEAMCEAFAGDRVAAAAGPVLIDPALAARYQALACAEYGRFHPGRIARLSVGAADGHGARAASRLPGNNMAYRRALVLELPVTAERGLVETEVNAALSSRGYTLAIHPRMTVTYAATDRHGARLGTRARHGRFYAGSRVARRSRAARLAWFAGSLLLPVVLAARALDAMAGAVRPAAWPATAIWICLLEGAWAAGESLGYLFGAGRSVQVWR